MKFDDLDFKMRVFETSHDHCVLPGIFIVARLDGRGFTKWTKSEGYEKPFDSRFLQMMTSTTIGLLEHSGFGILYGYTQSDEISLLFSPDEQSFGRKLRKLNSVLAGCASAFATQFLYSHSDSPGDAVVFDCRICQLPTIHDVEDYFRWRQEDAHRNALNGYCYWKLRQDGESKRKATRTLEGKGVAFKNNLLFERFGLNFNDVPKWQKRGVGVLWETYTKEGHNPITGETVEATRKRLITMEELPLGEFYGEFVRGLLEP